MRGSMHTETRGCLAELGSNSVRMECALEGILQWIELLERFQLNFFNAYNLVRVFIHSFVQFEV